MIDFIRQCCLTETETLRPVVRFHGHSPTAALTPRRAGDSEIAMTKEWRQVVGFAGYEVSRCGIVRSTRKELKQHVSRKYLQVILRRDCKSIHVRVHHAVLTAFVGPRPDGTEAAHIDGDRLNNHASNLAWKTPVENSADRVRHGTDPAGDRNPAAVLTSDVVLLMRRAHADGMSSAEVGRQFGLSTESAWAAIHSKWTHVPNRCQCRGRIAPAARKEIEG